MIDISVRLYRCDRIHCFPVVALSCDALHPYTPHLSGSTVDIAGKFTRTLAIDRNPVPAIPPSRHAPGLPPLVITVPSSTWYSGELDEKVSVNCGIFLFPTNRNADRRSSLRAGNLVAPVPNPIRTSDAPYLYHAYLCRGVHIRGHLWGCSRRSIGVKEHSSHSDIAACPFECDNESCDNR